MTDYSVTFDEIKAILLNILQANPGLDHPVYRENLDHIAAETQVTKQEFHGQKFITIFLTHNAIPPKWRKDDDFVTQGTPRFLKSLTVNEDYHVVSYGVPNFFSLDMFRQSPRFPEWQRSFRYVEKHDGTCLLVVVEPDRFIVRSRRKIYDISDSLSFLNFPGYQLGDRLESLADELRPHGNCTIFTEALFPHPAIHKLKVSPFYTRVLKGAGFCPYVDYPQQDNALNGIVWHAPLRLEHQETLDALCAKHGVKRPKTTHFPSLEEAEKYLKRRQNFEGFCVYCNNDQTLFKFKSRWFSSVRNTTAEIYHLLKPAA